MKFAPIHEIDLSSAGCSCVLLLFLSAELSILGCNGTKKSNSEPRFEETASSFDSDSSDDDEDDISEIVDLQKALEYLVSERDIEKIKNLEIFVSNGTADEVIPIHMGRMTNLGLKKVGLSHTYNEYDTGHTISNDCLNDILFWLQEKQQI